MHIFTKLMFSLPKPFGATVILTLSPGTMRVWMTAGVLSPVVPRSTGSFTTDFLKIADSHKGRTGTVKDENELADCLEIYEKYMQFKALFNGVFHHTAILFTEFSLQAKDAMEDAMIKEAKDVAEQKAALVEEPKAIQ